MNFNHISVLLNESIDSLNIKSDGIYVDGTMGAGGHSLQICKKLSNNGKLICIDQDTNAHIKAKEVLSEYLDRIIFVYDNFSNIDVILDNNNIEKIDGILLDLGVSSHQLDEADRGFSYHNDAPLDMRMDTNQDNNAFVIVNEYSQKELERIFYEYGEERWGKRIAEFIVTQRQEKKIETTNELVSVIKKAIPKEVRKEGSHPAKKVFQAIRIEVNNELNIIEETIIKTSKYLNVGGVISIITFHSLEDRIVKNAFRNLENPCTCPREFPVCICNKPQVLKVVTRKPIVPTEKEVLENKRARSSKLRVAVKV